MKSLIKPLLFLSIILFLFSCSASKQGFSKSDVRKAQKVIGLDFERNTIDTMYGYLGRNKEGFEEMRTFSLEYGTLPAVRFDPIPIQFQWPNEESCRYEPKGKAVNKMVPDSIAFATISDLSVMIKTGKITSTQLTKIYLERIKKYDPTLKAVVTLMEEDALAKAAKADQEIAAGKYKGPLHGIPYGVKDLVAIEGYPTTWGAMPYKDQILEETATIVQKLEEAGAICLAKLSSGSLARGDVWWGGRTMSPWDTLQGASGSSAGSGSATAAGLVGFSIGTETLGSITSPSTRNGVTGLRPTYGRVSRKGVMPLSWSMDKVGPICRSAEDCILVFQEIQGPDILDPTVYELDFCYKDDQEVGNFKVAILQDLFDKDTTKRGELAAKVVNEIKTILPTECIVDSLPSKFPFKAFDIILRAEAGAVFDELVRTGGVDEMVEQTARSRANSLRQSRFIPAVEYIQANRYRDLLIQEMHGLMQKYDVVITPTFGGTQLMITNLTGHPVVTIPVGLDEKGHPVSISFLGNLFEEDKILKIAKFIQEHTSYEEQYPPLFITLESKTD